MQDGSGGVHKSLWSRVPPRLRRSPWPRKHPIRFGTAKSSVTIHDQNGGELHQFAEADTPVMTTVQGGPVSDDQNALRIGARGPLLMEDFHFREKIFPAWKPQSISRDRRHSVNSSRKSNEFMTLPRAVRIAEAAQARSVSFLAMADGSLEEVERCSNGGRSLDGFTVPGKKEPSSSVRYRTDGADLRRDRVP